MRGIEHVLVSFLLGENSMRGSFLSFVCEKKNDLKIGFLKRENPSFRTNIKEGNTTTAP
jgi:hypothetical protein